MTYPSDRVLDPAVVAALDRRGSRSVLLLLASSGPGDNAALDGARTADGKGIDRGDAELWLLQQELAQAALEAGRFRASYRATAWAAVGAGVAALAAVVGVIEGLWPRQ